MDRVALPVIPAFGREAAEAGELLQVWNSRSQEKKKKPAKIHTILEFTFEPLSLRTGFLQIILFCGHF